MHVDAACKIHYGHKTCYIYFYNNFGKCRPILIILSLAAVFQMNCRKTGINLPPHLKLVATLPSEKLNVQLHRYSIIVARIHAQQAIMSCQNNKLGGIFLISKLRQIRKVR